MKQFQYTITDANGHSRTACRSSGEGGAEDSASAVKLIRGEKSADLKRLFGVMGLNVKCGGMQWTVSRRGSRRG